MLRGLAATAVVLAHVNERFGLGAIGVDVFFVISGFVMANAVRGKTPGQFLSDRFWRIYPAYWAVAVPWILFGFVSGAVSIGSAAASLMLWPQWFGVYSLFIGVSWTLVYELAFYLAVAGSIWLRSYKLPLLLFAAALVARPLVDHPAVDLLGHPIAIEFLFGIVIALAPKRGPAGLKLLISGLLWLALFPNPGLHSIIVNADDDYALHRLLLWGVPSALIVYGLICQEERLPEQWIRPLLLLGAASYSIYLVHGPVLALIDLPWTAELALALATGFAVWRFVEQPLLAYRKRRRATPDQKLPAADLQSVPVALN